MQFRLSTQKIVSVVTIVLFLLVLVAELSARRGGGRGGGRGGRGHSMGRAHHTRVGPASGGSFASRSSVRARSASTQHQTRSREVRTGRPSQPIEKPALSPEERQEKREEIRKKHKELREEARDEWEDHYDNWDYVSVGMIYTSSNFDTDDCEASVVELGVTYYQCDGIWYKRAYSGGSVSYVVVEGPSGN